MSEAVSGSTQPNAGLPPPAVAGDAGAPGAAPSGDTSAARKSDAPSSSRKQQPATYYFVNLPSGRGVARPAAKRGDDAAAPDAAAEAGAPSAGDASKSATDAPLKEDGARHADPATGVAASDEANGQTNGSGPSDTKLPKHSRLAFAPAATKPSRPATRRPMTAMSRELASTYRTINRAFFCRERLRGYESRLELQCDTDALAKLKANPPVPDEFGVINPPDEAYCDKVGNFVPQVGEEIHERFVVLEMLGSGSFGVVLRCFDQQRSELVALKVLRADPRFTLQGRTEARILTDIAAAARPELFANVSQGAQAGSHLREAAADAARRLQEGRAVGADHVLKLRKAFEWRGHVCIVTELLGKSLYDLLRISHYQGVSLRLTAKFGIQLGRALRLLASLKKPVVHVDVKPENILLVDDRRSAIKLVDFGSSCYAHVPSKAQYAQSRFCRAPEVVLRLPYECPVDTWSAATVLFEMHAGSPLFDGKSEPLQLQKFQQVLGPLPPAMVKRSRKVRLFRMLQQDGAVAPTDIDPAVLAELPVHEREGIDRAVADGEMWFDMLSYEDAARLPNGVAEADEARIAEWESAKPLCVAAAAMRLKTELLRKRLANYRRADRRRGGDGRGHPQAENPRDVDLFCLMLARMLRYEAEERVSVSAWSSDPALAMATAEHGAYTAAPANGAAATS